MKRSKNGGYVAAAGAAGGAAGERVKMDIEEEKRSWTGLAGAKRQLVEGVWRVPGDQVRVKG